MGFTRSGKFKSDRSLPFTGDDQYFKINCLKYILCLLLVQNIFILGVLRLKFFLIFQRGFSRSKLNTAFNKKTVLILISHRKLTRVFIDGFQKT